MRRKKYSSKKYSFGSEFAGMRQFCGLPVDVAAKLVGRSVQTVKAWEAGRIPCPAWATRLLQLESRYMEALYGIQDNRAKAGYCDRHHGAAMASNDAEYSTQIPLKLVL